MKKLFLSIAMMVVAMGAFAQDYYLKAEKFTLAPGEEKIVNIEMVNAEEVVCGIQCDIILPTGLNFWPMDDEGTILVYNSERFGKGKDPKTGWPATGTDVTDYAVKEWHADDSGVKHIRVVTYTNKLIPFKGTSGTLFSFKVKANDDTAIDTYEVVVNMIGIAKNKVEGEEPGGLETQKETKTNSFVFPVLKEAEAFPSFEGTLDGVDVTMNRVVKEGWNTMVLPFDMTNDEVVAAFGEGTKVYEYTETTAGKIKFNTKTDGIVANVPVLVNATKAIAADENQIFSGKKVTYAEAGTVPGMSYTYTGNYAGQIKINAGDYIFSNGSILKTQGNSTLKSYRAYIASNGGEVKSLSLEIDDVPTGIELVNGEVETVGDIYTVGGQLVRRNATVKGLPEGIYMINGNKVVVRK